MTLLSGDLAAVPSHVAVIMDGNGRWASMRGLKRFKGHYEGVESAKRIIRSCIDLKISYLTLYTFSTENWNRPLDEVSGLMTLLRAQLTGGLDDLNRRNIRLRVLGRRSDLDPDLVSVIERAEIATANNTALNLNLAFNYGGRDEIVRAAQKWARDVESGACLAGDLTESIFSSYLDTNPMPDPDLFLRPGGESRLSNYMLWQLAYAEIVILDCLWPDFSHDHMVDALKIYANRERRFGRAPIAGEK